MEGSIVGRLLYFVEAAWRRRYLILIPLLVSIPLSMIGSTFMPEKYVARTLLLLQEDNSDPLLLANKGYDNSSSHLTGPVLNQRKEALEALLKSRRVLDPVLKDIFGEAYLITPKLQASARNGLARSISVELIGSHFIELRLKGTEPKKLGTRLAAITTRFLESLLMAGQGSDGAVQLVFERRKLDQYNARKALSEFEHAIAEEQDGENKPTKLARLNKTVERLEAKKQELQVVELAIDEALSEIGGGRPSESEAPAQEVGAERFGDWPLENNLFSKMLTSTHAVTGNPKIAESSEVAAAKRRLVEEPKIAGLEARRDELKDEIGVLFSDLQVIKAAVERQERTSEQRKQLKRRLQDSTASLQIFLKRHANPEIIASRPMELVKSPESIRVIEAPNNPVVPAVSRRTYIIAGILAGFVLGCGAAILAETLDQRLRRPEEFVALLGAPVICRLPNSRGIDDHPLSQKIDFVQASVRPMHNVSRLRQEDRCAMNTDVSKASA